MTNNGTTSQPTDFDAAINPFAANDMKANPEDLLDQYNVVWETIGHNDRSCMPLGNGRVGMNLWVEEEGDLLFYISHTDSWSEVDRLVKLGQVRLTLSPNPFAAGKPFRQELQLRNGRVEITAGDADQEVRLQVFVDSDSPTIHVVGQSQAPIQVKATYETWRREKREYPPVQTGICDALNGNPPIPIWESADIVDSSAPDGVLFYHRNAWSCVEYLATLQYLGDTLDSVPDTIANRTFGGWLTLTDGAPSGDSVLTTQNPVTAFDLKITAETSQTETLEEWIDMIHVLHKNAPEGVASAERTARWWKSYWERSWIFVDGDEPVSLPNHGFIEAITGRDLFVDEPTPSSVTRAYVLYKWMTACGGRGDFPIKWNGSIFTMKPWDDPVFPVLEDNADFRRWGEIYLYQNTRLPYHSMLARGDQDMITTIFRYYRSFWDLNKARAKIYYGAEGQTSFDMTLSFGLLSGQLYGFDRTGKHPGDSDNKHGGNIRISPGLELVFLMLDYYDHTGDKTFLTEEILPYAKDMFLFIETSYPERKNGKIWLDPINSIETYFDTTNSLPVVAGMHAVIHRLLKLPEGDLTSEDRAYYQRVHGITPDIPKRVVDGQTLLAAAEIYDPKAQNVENPELYAVFPFRLYGLEKPDMELAVRTFLYLEHETHFKPFPIGAPPWTAGFSGWQQTGIEASMLGLADKAKTVITNNCQIYNREYRFPAMWGPIYDWVPDEDHGANILNTLQMMAFHTDGSRIFVLPAWPREWDVSFKFHAPSHTTVECVYRGGKIEKLDVSPAERRKDVILTLQETPGGATA